MSKLSERTLKKISEEIIRVIYDYSVKKDRSAVDGKGRIPAKGVTERQIADQLCRDKELVHRLLVLLSEKYPGVLVKNKKYRRWCVWDLTPEAKIKYLQSG